MVGHSKSVAEFHPEEEPAACRALLEGCYQLKGTIIAEIVREHAVGNVDLAETQRVVQNAQHLVLTEERRIQFHDRVQPSFFDEVARDLLDLVGRAAMHCR